MKVFTSALAVTAVVAQDAGDGSRGFDYGGFDSYDLSAFDDSYGFGGSDYYGFDENAYSDNYGVEDADAVGAGRETEVAADAAEDDDERKGERYFFTTVATTAATSAATTTTVAGTNHCWKCDAMSYATCASAGAYQNCPLGDQDCCFVEIREEYQQLQQLCTGCKDAQACMDNKAENFNPTAHTDGEHVDQCRPDYRQQRIGKRENNQSVCRQCFKTCDSAVDNGANCFGSINGNTPQNIAFKLNTNKANYPWTSALTAADFVGFGIPTLFRADKDAGLSNTINAEIAAFNAATLNLYFASNTDGKVDPSNNDGTADAAEMIYWGLHGASKTWWSSDLKAKQDALVALGGQNAGNGNF